MNTELEKIAKIWPGVQNIFSVPHNQKEYNRLVNILDGFRSSKHKKFPYQLLMKDVLIKEDRILKAISR